MICSSKPFAASSPEHLVTETLEEIAVKEITVELVDPEEEALWNKLIRTHHYLKEHRMVGESLRYVAKQNGQWIALLGWSSAAFHLRARDAWIGWTEAQRKAGRHLLACNARFALLAPKGQSPNLASHILSLNLQRLSEDWLHRRVASIVAIATAAIVAGNDSLLDIGEFSQSLNQNQLRSLRASRSRKSGKLIAPSESTLRTVLSPNSHPLQNQRDSQSQRTPPGSGPALHFSHRRCPAHSNCNRGPLGRREKG